MSLITRALALGLLVLPLAGCGSNSSAPSGPSPFAGSWAGTALDSTGGTSGVSLSVTSAGRFTGTWYDGSDMAVGGSLSGSVSNGGSASVTFSEAGPPVSSVAAKGTTSIGQDGHWHGSLTVTSGDLKGTGMTLNLARQ